MPVPDFIKKYFANPSGEKFVLTFRNNPVLLRIATACMPRHTFYKKATYRIVNRKGINYQLDLSEWVDWNIYFHNEVEPREKLFSLIKEGMIVIDIGANMGEVSLNIANRVRETGKVYSFEPSSTNYKKCFQNILLNEKLKNSIDLNFCALGDKSTSAFLKIADKNNLGMNSISDSGEKIEIRKLDDIVAEKNISKIDLIKLDVEGYELKVLKGAEQCIKKFHPALFIELDDELLKKQGDSSFLLLNWLNEHNYKIIDPLLSTEELVNGHFDIIAQ